MVRTRSLGRTLGKVIGRTLKREDNRDSDEASQRRRPITSACKQQEVVVVAKEHPHVDDAIEEVFQQPKEAVGFSGRSRDISVLIAYADQVGVIVWNGEIFIECPELKLSSHGREVQKFGRPTTEIEGPLIACSLDTSDQGLISTFMERWHKETSRFHLPVGKVTITLDDVASLLHLPIIGAFHTFETLYVNETSVEMKPELRQYSVMGHMYNYHGYKRFIIPNVRPDIGLSKHFLHHPQPPLATTNHLCSPLKPHTERNLSTEAESSNLACGFEACVESASKDKKESSSDATRNPQECGYCSDEAGRYITHVHVVFLDAFRDLSQSGSYAKGVAALVHMYDNLNDTCKSGGRQLTGYITLLQCWIYDHFPSIVEAFTDEDYDEKSPRAYCWTSTKAFTKALQALTYCKCLD
ncbi:Serine/threonine-protein phosphatase 7 long form [Glycine soja]